MVRSLADKDAQWKVMSPTQDYEVAVLDVIDGTIYIYTNYGAPRYRLMTATLDNPAMDQWKELIPEQKGCADRSRFHRARPHDSYIQHRREQTMPMSTPSKAVGFARFSSPLSILSVLGKPQHPRVFYAFTSFAYPSALYRYDVDKNESTLYRGSDIGASTPMIMSPSRCSSVGRRHQRYPCSSLI